MNDIYKTPKSEVENSQELSVKPIKAVAVGLLLCLLCMSIINSIIALIYASLLGVDLMADVVPVELAGYYPYLITDMVVSIVFLVLCGKFLTKYAPGQETKYALIVGISTSIIYVAASLVSYETYSAYPLWYAILSVLLMPVSIYYGAKLGAKT